MKAEQFGMFDLVRLNEGFRGMDAGWEVNLRKGKSGCVLELGKAYQTLLVEFKVGRGDSSTDYAQVEVPVEYLDIERMIGRRFSEPSPYLKTALAIKAGTFKPRAK